MESQIKNTVVIVGKTRVDHKFYPILDLLYATCAPVVKKMLADRTKASSKYYHEIPCVVAKSLITKYQKNNKCKEVCKLVIPVCGDKGKQVKLVGNNIRVPAITGKEFIPIRPIKPIIGNIRQVEFFRKNKVWYMSYCFNTIANEIITDGFLGIDRNERDNVATMADLESGKVKRLGPDIKPWKDNFKNRKAKLQAKKEVGVNKLLVKINRKQSNRTKEINHVVSKQIVDYAVNHRKAIVLESLGNIKDSKKIGKSVKKSNWSYFQLELFILYKASLYGVPVIYIDPAYTSKACSRCGSINIVNGKKFKCICCGHEDHRDSNAAFNIAIKGREKVLNDLTDNERELSAGFIDDPLTSKGLVGNDTY